MASNNDKQLEFLITARDEMSAKLDSIRAGLGQLETETKKTSKGFGNLTKAFVGFIIAGEGLRFMKTAVQGFREAENAMFRLATITNNATGATKEQVKVLFDQARALERVGVIDATTIMNGQAKLATFDLQTKSIEQLTPKLLDLVVGEYGLSASSEQVVNTANGVGKALQGNVKLFTDQGFIVYEAQKHMLKYGDESERVATINEILGSTYDDLNAKASQTDDGGMRNLQNRVNALKDDIGQGLSMSIGILIGAMNDSGGALNNTGNQMEGFNRTVYSLTHLILGLGNAMSATFQGVKTFGTTVGRGLGQAVKNQVTLVKGIAKGDLAGALQDIVKSSNETGAKVGEDFIKSSEKAGKAWDNLKKNLDEASNMKNFKMPEFNLFGTKENVGGLGGAINSESKSITKELANLTDKYKDFNENVDDTLFDLEQSHKEKMGGFADSIKRVREEMSKAQDEFKKQEQSDKMGVAGSVIQSEKDIADIQQQLAKETSVEKIRELQAELAKKQQAMLANADFIASIQAQVDEARRVSNLTELEKAIEDFNTKREMAQQELDEKMSQLQMELNAVKEARKNEKDLYKEKTNFIKQLGEEALLQQTLNIATGLQMTKEAVEKEIEYYKSLAEAVSSAKSGNTAGVNRAQTKLRSVNDAIISPNGDIITTHPDDYLIATKNPQSLGGSGLVVNIHNPVLLDNAMVQALSRKLGQALRQEIRI